MLRACLAVLVLVAIGLGLFSTLGTAVADSGETVTTELQPGLNLAGWTEAEASVEAIFDAIPELELVYAWDAENQRFRWAARVDSLLHGDLETLTPGMGLWLAIAGGEPVTWTRPLIPQTGLAPLHEGWNLVVWAGDDGIATSDALQFLDGIVEEVVDGGGREPASLALGDVFWLKVSASREWDPLYEPPRIEFVSEFGTEQQAKLRASVDDTVDYFLNRFGLAVSELTVKFGDAEADMTCGGYAARVIYLKEPCFSAIAHEYSHAIQENLERGAPTPGWLIEGVANRWSAQYYDARGFSPLRRAYPRHRRASVTSGDCVPRGAANAPRTPRRAR